MRSSPVDHAHIGLLGRGFLEAVEVRLKKASADAEAVRPRWPLSACTHAPSHLVPRHAKVDHLGRAAVSTDELAVLVAISSSPERVVDDHISSGLNELHELLPLIGSDRHSGGMGQRHLTMTQPPRFLVDREAHPTIRFQSLDKLRYRPTIGRVKLARPVGTFLD